MNNLKLVLSFYAFFSIIVLVVSVFLFIYTKKYTRKKNRVLGLFLDLTKRDGILLSTNFLGLLIGVYCAINIKNYNNIFLYMILFNCGISILFSFDIHLIFSEILYTSISVVVLKLLSLINIYLTNVSYDKMTHVLSIVFLITIIIYLMFSSVRKMDLLLKKHKYVKGNI